MKQLKTVLIQILIVLPLMLPWTTTEALDLFEKAGVISSIGYDKFSVSGKQYRIAPEAVLNSNDAGRKTFSDFKKGDEIYFKGKVLNGVYYVDIIYYETPVPS